MADMDSNLGAILGNPEMMQKIMSLAQEFQGDRQPSPEPVNAAPVGAAFPDLDPAMLQTLMGFAQQSGIDQDQQVLLQALRPYLAQHRLSKLERAMQAARMAGMATTLLPNLLPGR